MSSEDDEAPNNGGNGSNLPSGAAIMRMAGMGGGQNE